MTLKDLEIALKLPDGWKRSFALADFRKTEFGIEALPLLEKALDDKSISVVLSALKCIGQLGPQALVGESADMETPKGLVASLFSLGDRVWDYSGCKNCYSTCLNTLVQLGYTGKPLLDYICRNIRPADDDDFVDSLAGLKAIGSPEAIELLKGSAASRLPKLNKTYARKVQAILKKVGSSPGEGNTKSAAQDWYPLHTLEIKSGELWAGDPTLPNADDGFIVKLTTGKYVVECDGHPRRCKAIAKLRVRLESAKSVKRGKKLGETGTDCATIGICEIAAFEAAYEKGGADLVQKAIDSQRGDFGVLTVPKFPDIIMPFVPTGSDGAGPVFALMSGTKRVGIELTFMEEGNA